jgi:hypothetical protein
MLLAALSVVSFAQSKGSGKTATPAGSSSSSRAGSTAEQIAERNVKALQQQLGLTADQYTQAYAAELEYQQLHKSARDGGYDLGPGQTMQSKMARDSKYKAIMTAAQYTTYEAGLKH